MATVTVDLIGTEAFERMARALEKCRGALADIANADDMTLRLARAKAKRIYDETGADIEALLGMREH